MNTNDTYSKRLIDSLHGKLIVSCQAYPGEPMRHPDPMSI